MQNKGAIFIVIHRATTYQLNSMVILANQLIDYIPEEVKGDRYYDTISEDNIFEICSRNTALKQNIESEYPTV